MFEKPSTDKLEGEGRSPKDDSKSAGINGADIGKPHESQQPAEKKEPGGEGAGDDKQKAEATPNAKPAPQPPPAFKAPPPPPSPPAHEPEKNIELPNVSRTTAIADGGGKIHIGNIHGVPFVEAMKYSLDASREDRAFMMEILKLFHSRPPAEVPGQHHASVLSSHLAVLTSSSEAMIVEATVRFVAEQAGYLSLGEFTHVVEVLLPRVAFPAQRLVPVPIRGKDEEPSQQYERVPPPQEVWQMDPSGFLDRADVVVDGAGEHNFVRPFTPKEGSAVAARHRSRMAVVRSSASRLLMEAGLLFHPSVRIGYFVREFTVAEAVGDPAFSGQTLLRTINEALKEVVKEEQFDAKRTNAAAEALNLLWSKNILRPELESLLAELARGPSIYGLIQIAQQCKDISFATRAKLIFERVERLPRPHRGSMRAERDLFSFLLHSCKDPALPDFAAWQKAIVERTESHPREFYPRFALRIATLIHLFDPAYDTCRFLALFIPFADNIDAVWLGAVLSDVCAPSLWGDLNAALEFLKFDTISNWAGAQIADEADRGGSQKKPPENWEKWSDGLVDGKHFDWLLGFDGKGGSAGFLTLAEWFHRRQAVATSCDGDRFTAMLKGYLEKCDREEAMSFGLELHAELERLMLAIQNHSNLLVRNQAEKTVIRLPRFSRAEQLRLLAPMAARRKSLREYLKLLRSLPRQASTTAPR